jgi:hypothetical protein
VHGQTKAWLLRAQGEEVPAHTAEVSLLFGSHRLAEVVVVVDVVVAVAIPHDAHQMFSLRHVFLIQYSLYIECVLQRMCSSENVFFRERVLYSTFDHIYIYRMCALKNVFSTVYRTCSLKNVLCVAQWIITALFSMMRKQITVLQPTSARLLLFTRPIFFPSTPPPFWQASLTALPFPNEQLASAGPAPVIPGPTLASKYTHSTEPPLLGYRDVSYAYTGSTHTHRTSHAPVYSSPPATLHSMSPTASMFSPLHPLR